MKLKWLKDKLGEKFYPIAHATGVVVTESKTLDSKLYEIDTEIGNKANKTEIPTELPANGGNSATVNGHTVNADVPENAVFTDTVYDDTEVKESISAQSTEIMDIKMLGWSVPKECSIQNEVNDNQFIQKVGRIDLGNYNYGYSSTQGFYIRNFNSSEYGIADNNQNYLMGYTIYTNMNDLMQSDKGLLIYKTSFNIKDSAYTDPSAFKSAMQGKYLYYELATPITTTIDGNEIGETVSDLRGDMYFEKEISLAKAQLIRNGSYSDINIISSLFLFGANGKFGLSRGYISLSIPVSFSKKDEIYIKLPYKQYGYKQDNLLPYIYKTVFCAQGDFNGKIIGTCNLSYYSGSDDEGISLTIDINDNYSFTDDNMSSAYVNLRF